jgi:hypothetical protein
MEFGGPNPRQPSDENVVALALASDYGPITRLRNLPLAFPSCTTVTVRSRTPCDCWPSRRTNEMVLGAKATAEANRVDSKRNFMVVMVEGEANRRGVRLVFYIVG